jgi:hypothetical protein
VPNRSSSASRSRLHASNPWHRIPPPPCRLVAAARVRPGRRPGRGGSLRAAWVVRVFSPRLTQRCPKASGSHPYSPECLEDAFCVLPHGVFCERNDQALARISRTGDAPRCASCYPWCPRVGCSMAVSAVEIEVVSALEVGFEHETHALGDVALYRG